MGNSEYVFETTDATFEADVIKGDDLVIVDFWAAWCGPCKMLAPNLEKLADQFGGKVRIAKLDVDAHPHAATKYQVKGIPTLIFFKSGAIVHQMVGNQPLDVMVSTVNGLL
jgi:thioredoxin 1